jgi:protein arginine kinase activator
MMRCQHCDERDAVVHLTQIIENQVTTMHLCEACAAEKGIESSGPGTMPLNTEFLATVGKGVGAGLPGMEDAPHATCPTCGLTMQELRDLGRLGCVDCYKAFEGPLRELLRRLHGSTTHVGERYTPPDAGDGPPVEEATELRERLKEAVEAENFELAAELRDLLRTAE